MKTFKWLITATVAFSLAIGAVALSACGPTEPEEEEENNSTPTTFIVTYYDSDGTTVLDTEEVEEGETATEWTPEKDGYVFVDWYATPNFSHEFDFDQAITRNTSAFAQWQSATQTVDTRTFYILGSGTSPILSRSNWGDVIGEDFQMTKDADSNTYTYTLDLYEGDLFQFAINGDWHNQRGVGYLTTMTLEDGTEVFSGSDTIGDNSSYRLNIRCELAGNYTFTLTTHPDDDQYETGNASYTEENKEAFNINPLDTIEWVRNGDVSESDVEVITDFYIKGAGITNWADMYNASTQMTNTDPVYTLTVYLEEGEEFMFTSRNTIGGEVSVGAVYLRASNLDEDSRQYLGGTTNNMTALASGTYTFTYNSETEVLSATFDADTVPEPADYYIDGTFNPELTDWSDYCFNEDYKLTDEDGDGVFEINNVTLAANSQIIIQAFKEGSTERGEWGTEGYNGLGSYNYTYLSGGGDAFSAVGDGNNNILVLTEGAYDITFDEYSKIITITAVGAGYDIYISGSVAGQTGWDPAFNEQFRFTQSESDSNVYELTITLAVDEQFGLRIFPAGATADDYPNGVTGTDYTWVGVSAAGTEGVTSTFSGAHASNFQCTVAGTYRLSYNVTTGVLNIYAVS